MTDYVIEVDAKLLALCIDAALIRAHRPLTAHEIALDTGIAEADVLRLIKSRLRGRKATLVKHTKNGEDRYTLTAERFQKVKPQLEGIQLGPAAWARAERKFDPPGRPRRLT